MEDEAEPNPIGPTLWRLFGYFLPGQKVTRPAGRKPLPIKEMLDHCPLIRPRGKPGRPGGPVCRPYEKSGETLSIKL